MSARYRGRRSLRFRGYDYTRAGAYFITLCVRNRERLFGAIVGGEMRLNACGEIARDEWARSAEIRAEIELDVFIIMPDHMHAIVWLMETHSTDYVPGVDVGGNAGMDVGGNAGMDVGVNAGVDGRPPLRGIGRSLGSLVAGYKSAVTKRINALRDTPGAPVWQREYHDRIIRDDRELQRIRRYIADNPAAWGRRR